MADAVDLKSTEGNLVWVRLPPALLALIGFSVIFTIWPYPARDIFGS